MEWTYLHGRILGDTFSNLLGAAETGAIAFVRCLTPDVVERLAMDANFSIQDWQILRVADSDNDETRTITADQAVEKREAKSKAALLLVDTDRAGAGMDGIYSASREVDEKGLFKEARRLAAAEVTRQLSRTERQYAEDAIKKAEGFGRQFSVSPWTAFDFLCRVAANKRDPGAYFHLLGLWPVLKTDASATKEKLDFARRFVDQLLGTAALGLTIPARIESLRLAKLTVEQRRDLEGFLHTSETQSLLPALEKLADKEHLWVGALQIENATAIESIELVSWRNRNGTIAKWSGLTELSYDEPPQLVLNPDPATSGDYSNLEIRWKARPSNLDKNACEYHISVLTDMDEELAVREVAHSAKREEKCRFSNDDFSLLNEDSLVSAKVVVSVVGNDVIRPQESDEFLIRFGEPPEKTAGGAGKMVRTFSEGVAELNDRESVSAIANDPSGFSIDARGNSVLLRTAVSKRLSLRVSYPPLMREVESQWMGKSGIPGRWRVKVRASGAQAGEVDFIRCEGNGEAWNRVTTASRRFAESVCKTNSVVGQIYDDTTRAFDSVKEYIRAWTLLLESGCPSLALCNTVEVQSLSGRMIGLIVLPMHPLRVAWHAAYDNLVFHAAFEQNQKARAIGNELQCLDGAMFPAFLPNPTGGSCVFADTLGFHAVGMVPDTDKEPKAAVAILARALGEGPSIDSAPTVGDQSAKIVGDEIIKYLDCHNRSRLLHVHALRSGDGLTIARSLGYVHDHLHIADDENGLSVDSERQSKDPPIFSLEMYPSEDQRGIAGRFIVEARERRRSGAGVVSIDDRWMLESLSLPGGVNMPKLRWARKDQSEPETAAHVAVAFDTFESHVVSDGQELSKDGPCYAFGLLSFYKRHFTSKPNPMWHSTVPLAKDGEKHPSERRHTERLARLQYALHSTVARSLGAMNGKLPALHTEISPEKAENLKNLHRLCDWVITLDRNAGIEYFDSPRDIGEIYDAYVIDCVPEREDLGCLQLITSTSNLDEVRRLLDGALDQMGLSRSRRNAEFLLAHLKALSGRLAIRLTGDRPPISELIALAFSQANCTHAREEDPCWLSLEHGFIVPVDDVRDLLPPFKDKNDLGKNVRPDLVYVTMAPRKGLIFQFIEVKYRRDLRAARAPEILRRIQGQTVEMNRRWYDWYSHEECSAFRGVRRAKLARVLRFYADKARRHHLQVTRYNELVSEIDRMIEKGGAYVLDTDYRGDRGWVFCPEYAGANALEISPDNWDTRIFIFGPGLMPDLGFDPASFADPSPVKPDGSEDEGDKIPATGLSNSTNESTESNSRADTAEDQIAGSRPPSILFGTDGITNTEVRWPLTIKGNPHLLVAGLPGMGKTTCLLNLCQQMIRVDIKPIIFSFHEDIDERLERSVDSVRFIDFNGLGFNPLHVVDRDSHMAYLDVAGAMRDIFNAIYPDLGDMQADRIRRAIRDSFTEAGWGDASSASADLKEPAFNRFVDILRSDPKPNQSLRSLLARLDELDDYGFFQVSESYGSLWESEQPTVVRVHTTQNDILQRAFTSLVFYGLYKDMFRRGIQDRITHALIFDEAHRAAGLKLIPTMAKECRKYGISLVLASQEARDFDVSVFSAIANYLVLRLNEIDAKALVRNVSSSQRERALIDKIKQMDRFKALHFCEGNSRPFSVDLMDQT